MGHTAVLVEVVSWSVAFKSLNLWSIQVFNFFHNKTNCCWMYRYVWTKCLPHPKSFPLCFIHCFVVFWYCMT